ncbi:MAG: hypothetical protein MJ229_06545 [bacterium]|nr:hypothetical protein [bacterium]
MSFQIDNQNYNPYKQVQQPAMGLNGNPNVQIDTEKVKENIKNSDNIVTVAAQNEEKGKTAAITAGVWFALSKAMDKFNKHCATSTVDGKSTSLLQKIQEKSQDLGNKFDSSKVGKSSENVFGKFTKFMNEKVVSKSKILNSIFHNPNKPVNSMAKSMINGTVAETAQDAIEAFERFVTVDGKVSVDKLKNLGIDEALFNEIKATPYAHVDDIIKAAESLAKSTKDKPIQVAKFMKVPFTNMEFFPKAQEKILGRNVYPSELVNKLKVLSGKPINAATQTLNAAGKGLPKAFLRSMEGLTNGTAGGKIAILLQAYSIADSVMRAIKAPKGEKLSTFTEGLTYDLASYLSIPLAMNIMYHAAGAKYIGMTPEKVQEYKNGIAELNAKVKAASIDKQTYRAEVKKLKGILNDGLKAPKEASFLKKTGNFFANIVRKPVKAAGKILSTGLDKVETTNIFGKLSNKFKGFGGGAMRFCLCLFVIVPPIAKGMTKISHLIFGRPTKSIIDDETEETNKTEETKEVSKPAQQLIFEAPKAAQAVSSTNVVEAKPVQTTQQTQSQNLLEIYKQTHNIQNEKPQSFEAVYTRDMIVEAPKTKPNLTINNKPEELTYIPSSLGYIPQISTAKKEKIDTAMKESSPFMKLIPTKEEKDKRAEKVLQNANFYEKRFNKILKD